MTFSDNASSSPFAQALSALQVPHRIHSRKIVFHYRRRLAHLVLGLPRLVAFAVESALWSRFRAGERPGAVVVGSHLEAMVHLVLGRLIGMPIPIVLLGFIHTRRTSSLLDALRCRYLDALLSRIDLVICHSSLEASRYETLFPAARGRFRFIPYGLHFHGHDRDRSFRDPTDSPCLSAGRSGRDYALLTRVFRGNGLPLRIICDAAEPLAGCVEASNITLLRQCHDDAYVRELRAAGIVIVPLAVDDISAGQMVLIQAMALAKPLIVTRTSTVREYITHEVEALLVSPGDERELNAAVMRLRENPALARRLAETAAAAFEARHSMRAYVAHIVEAVESGLLPRFTTNSTRQPGAARRRA
jgi:glycosyltransferase involved in cell wall biosynthesis